MRLEIAFDELLRHTPDVPCDKRTVTQYRRGLLTKDEVKLYLVDYWHDVVDRKDARHFLARYVSMGKAQMELRDAMMTGDAIAIDFAAEDCLEAGMSNEDIMDFKTIFRRSHR